MATLKFCNAHVNCKIHGGNCEFLLNITQTVQNSLVNFHYINNCSGKKCAVFKKYLEKHPELEHSFHFHSKNGTSEQYVRNLFYKSADEDLQEHDIETVLIRVNRDTQPKPKPKTSRYPKRYNRRAKAPIEEEESSLSRSRSRSKSLSRSSSRKRETRQREKQSSVKKSRSLSRSPSQRSYARRNERQDSPKRSVSREPKKDAFPFEVCMQMIYACEENIKELAENDIALGQGQLEIDKEHSQTEKLAQETSMKLEGFQEVVKEDMIKMKEEVESCKVKMEEATEKMNKAAEEMEKTKRDFVEFKESLPQRVEQILEERDRRRASLQEVIRRSKAMASSENGNLASPLKNSSKIEVKNSAYFSGGSTFTPNSGHVFGTRFKASEEK